MARENRLLRASGRDAAYEPAFAGLTRRAVGDRYPGSYVADMSWGVSEAIDLLDNAPTLRLDHLGLAGDDQRQTVADSAVTVPTRKRFAVWSLHYLMVLAAVDALIGGVAVAVPASMSAYALGVPGGAAALSGRLALLASSNRPEPRLSPVADRHLVRRVPGGAASRNDDGRGLRATGWTSGRPRPRR